MLVYIVSFRPFDDRACVGGFDWFFSKETAVKCFEQTVQESGDACVVRLLERELEAEEKDSYAITDMLDSEIDSLEFHWPAVHEHTPA